MKKKIAFLVSFFVLFLVMTDQLVEIYYASNLLNSNQIVFILLFLS